jgi:hypothetical protein
MAALPFFDRTAVLFFGLIRSPIWREPSFRRSGMLIVKRLVLTIRIDLLVAQHLDEAKDTASDCQHGT